VIDHTNDTLLCYFFRTGRAPLFLISFWGLASLIVSVIEMLESIINIVGMTARISDRCFYSKECMSGNASLKQKGLN